MVSFFITSYTTEADSTPIIRHGSTSGKTLTLEDWTLDTWKLGDTKIVRGFRDFLRRNGVYVVKNGASIAGNIQAIITNPEEPIWTRRDPKANEQWT